MAEVGLKRKFSFSYFRENFAKISRKFIFVFREKIIRKYTNMTKIFAKTKIEAKIFAKTNISTSTIAKILLFHNFLAEIFATIFAKTKIFAKITSFSHDFRFSRKWKKSVFVSTLGGGP
jgi:hypothetical protein